MKEFDEIVHDAIGRGKSHISIEVTKDNIGTKYMISPNWNRKFTFRI